MKYTFQHFVDIQTSASSLTLFQVQAGGEYTLNRIKHLFPAFKYIKLGRVSVKFLPASTLPVDPLGLSYDDDDPQTVDPRDQMNPGLVRITNGEDIFTDFSGLSHTAQEQMYINTMLDPRWSKFMLQSGFKRSAVPLYWTVGQLAQDPYPGSTVNLPGLPNAASDSVTKTSSWSLYDGAADDSDKGYTALVGAANRGYTDPRGLFQTGHRGRMGWMPTDAFFKFEHRVSAGDEALEVSEQPMIQPLPEVNVITCLLPKAYKTIYYYRCFITETVYLSGLKNTGINDGAGNEYRAIDNFVRVPNIYPDNPSAGRLPGAYANYYNRPDPQNTGGGE